MAQRRRGVSRSEVGQHHLQGPRVGDDVMGRYQHDVVVVCEPPHGNPQQRPDAQVERPARCCADQFRHILGDRDPLHGDPHCTVRGHRRQHAAPGSREGRPQGVVPLDHRLHRPLQRVRVELSAQAQR